MFTKLHFYLHGITALIYYFHLPFVFLLNKGNKANYVLGRDFSGTVAAADGCAEQVAVVTGSNCGNNDDYDLKHLII